MPRSARQPSRKAGPTVTRAVAESVGGVIARNPAAVGGSTAFLIALFYVSANALWYQPYLHPQPLMVTRGYPDGAAESRRKPDDGTTFRIEREEAAQETATAPARPQPDPTVTRVQTVLKDLQIYAGPVDGLPGPATRRSIEQYQTRLGLAVTGRIDDDLLRQLDALDTTAGIIPAPSPAVAEPNAPGLELTGQDRISRIQAGLRAFGSEGIDIDGIAGPKTRSAVKDFQSLFGLAETGEPDLAVLRKMREIGLTN